MTLFILTSNEWLAFWLSIKVAFWCSLISLPLALYLGWVLARKSFVGKAVLEGFTHLPLVLPPVVTGYLLLLFLGRNGFIGTFLYQKLNITIAFSFSAAVIAAIVISLPLLIRSISSAIEMTDIGLEEAAASLGFNKIQVFFKVTLPVALPGILSGFVLSFARSLGEFGATITFAGNIAGKTQTMPLAIYNFMQTPGQEQNAARLVIISVIISFIAIAASNVLLRKSKGKGVKRK